MDWGVLCSPVVLGAAAVCWAGALMALSLFAYLVKPVPWRIALPPRCGSCGYDMAGLTPTTLCCPECGGTTLAVLGRRERAMWICTASMAVMAPLVVLAACGEDPAIIVLFSICGAVPIAGIVAMNIALWHASPRTRWLVLAATLPVSTAGVAWLLLDVMDEDPIGFVMVPVLIAIVTALGSGLFVPAILAAMACNALVPPRGAVFS